MIVDIKKGGFAKGLIEYHELKIQKGRGVMIMDTTCSQNKEQRIARIIDTVEANTSKKLKHKFAHISISFAHGESVSPEKQRQIAEKYLEDMGYANCPRILYEHQDTKHSHFHIVTTTIDLDGKKIPALNDFKKSQIISRQIEKQFGLQVTEYTKQEGNKVQEINARKFKILKGLEKLSNIPDAQESLMRVLNPSDQHAIIRDKMSDTQIAKLIKLRDGREDPINQLYKIIRQHDAEYKTDKEKLRERLQYIKELSSTREQFMENVTKQGLYIRKIAQGDNTFSLTYGIPEANFYVNDKALPIALRYDYLFTDKKVTLSFDSEAQQRYLKTMVTKSLKASSTQKEFESALQEKGIKYEYAENKRGTYGISFSSENLKDPIVFKGSEIGVSWNQINKKLEINSNITPAIPKVKNEQPAKDNLPHVPKGMGKSLDTSNDDEEKRKKRNRDQEMNPD